MMHWSSVIYELWYHIYDKPLRSVIEMGWPRGVEFIEIVVVQSFKAKKSPRLRMNYNFHQTLDDKCHRMLNAVEPGAVVPIHKHPTKDESFVILRGKVRVTTHNDDGSIIEDVVLSQESGNYGVIPKNVWHKLESLESGSVIFECKEGPFVPHDAEGILTV